MTSGARSGPSPPSTHSPTHPAGPGSALCCRHTHLTPPPPGHSQQPPARSPVRSSGCPLTCQEIAEEACPPACLLSQPTIPHDHSNQPPGHQKSQLRGSGKGPGLWVPHKAQSLKSVAQRRGLGRFTRQAEHHRLQKAQALGRGGSGGARPRLPAGHTGIGLRACLSPTSKEPPPASQGFQSCQGWSSPPGGFLTLARHAGRARCTEKARRFVEASAAAQHQASIMVCV